MKLTNFKPEQENKDISNVKLPCCLLMRHPCHILGKILTHYLLKL